MNVTCQNCEATIKVPENKIPKGRSFSIKCPSCKEKIVAQPDESSPLPEAETWKGVDDLFDTARFETGTLLRGAMICLTEPKQFIKITDKLGITAHAPKNLAEALGRLRYNEYGLIVVSEGFEKQEEGNSMLDTMRKLTMQKRRKIYLVYVATNVKSFGRLEAAAMSVNLLISTEDLKDFEKIAQTLKRGMAEHQLDYKVYNESLSAIKGA